MFATWAGSRLSFLLEVAFCAAALMLVSAAVAVWLMVAGAVVLLWRALPWVVGAAALVVILLRVMEVSESECGLWQEYPHGGFAPDAPQWCASE